MPLQAADRPPNVVILYTDDMGVANVSYGDKEAKFKLRTSIVWRAKA